MRATAVVILLVLNSCLSLAFLLDDRCPDCHWNGVCTAHTGTCHCYAGFSGTDCSVDCGCNGHGVCQSDNTCKCDAGWLWSNASRRCDWDCSCDAGVPCIGPGICGCANSCKYGTCWNGQCECWEGYTGSTCSVYNPDVMMNRNVSVGVNLGGISYWSSELKFVDVAKQSQEWITERLEGAHAHEWNTHEHDTVHWRQDGYPAQLPPTLIVVKLMLRSGAGIHAPKGNYTVLYDGEGEIHFKLVKHTIHRNGKGRMVVEFDVNSGGILLQLVKTNPSNPIHNIRVILPGFEERHEKFPFYPPFLETLARYSEIRYMDFFHTNGHTPEPTTWATRRLANFHSQTSSKGAAIEYAVLLSNAVGANPWFNQPHAADDVFITRFASLAKATLRPDLTVYVEYSNEVWNGIFRQTRYTQEQGMKLGLDPHSFRAGMMYYNRRSSEIMDIWTSVFGSAASRLIPVWAWQTGYHDYTRQAIQDLGSRVSKFKAIGITGYFSCDKVTYSHNITTLTFNQIAQYCKLDVAKSESDFKYFLDMAKSHKLKLLMYEGGPGLESSRSHDHNVTSQAIEFNRHGLMEMAVTDVLEAWYTIVNSDPNNTFPGGLFNYFSSTGTPSKYGSWGMLEYTGQDPASVPKYRAVQRFIDRHFNNHVLGPACSIVMLGHSTGSTVFACFRQSHFRCGVTTSLGATWKFYPDISVNGSTLVLDGYDTVLHVLFVRSVDSMAVNTYYTVDTLQGGHWQTSMVFDYHMKLARPSVRRRLPAGYFSTLDTSHMNCN